MVFNIIPIIVSREHNFYIINLRTKCEVSENKIYLTFIFKEEIYPQLEDYARK
jgi:hypothetical protein